MGPCEAAIDRHYFDEESNTCSPFKWGGCEPNGNNFESRKECLKTCRNPCLDKPNPIKCDDKTTNYYYNKEKNRCYTFGDGECGGNGNHFESEDECRGSCVR